MAASRSTTRTAGQKYRRQALIWLIATLLLGVFTALVWMFSQTPAMGAKIENEPISAPQASTAELEQPLKIESLHELDTDVQPISFDATVKDLRSYPDEFKDKRYLLANKGKWTVQVMNVAENDVIVSYLESREDRAKFAYFRYLDENDQVRYMLTYGLMSSPQEAVGAAKLIDFKLPANVRVLPEEINRYVSIIDNYERPDPVKDLSTKRTRSVNLRPTKREVPVRQKIATNDSADEQAVSNNANRGGQGSSSAAESIRQSADTSDTLTVNEERTVDIEGQTTTTQSSTDTNRKPEADNKKSTTTGNSTNNGSGNNNAPKKPPVVEAPKPPSGNANSTNNTNNAANKNANAAGKNANANASANNNTSKNNASKNNSDSIRELIEEKSN
ncbi:MULTISPECIES: hypothetical protein [unclassified Psychrobacter]|uniref:hypothetical protein n=1 Tax=unclassified Psychrobacter TaxID=196806 RepID=UPI0025E7FE10|nr:MULTISPECIES: hypothetical protein [unclassified Psychrobacter]